MRNSNVTISSAIAALMAFGCVSANAGTYIPVPMVPGAVSQIVFSINNHNVVAGSFRDSANVEHGFFGPMDGSNWISFDLPGDGTTGTEGRYINNHGAITGIATNPKFEVGEEFYRTPDGRFKVFRANGKKLDGIAQGINDDGTSVGDYLLHHDKALGYLGQKGNYIEDFKLHLNGNKHFLQISPRGIDKTGALTAGYYVDSTGAREGFIQADNGKLGVIAYSIGHANAVTTVLESINEDVVAAGQWTDNQGSFHALTARLAQGKLKITDLDPGDGSTSQQAWGINDHGLVAMSTSLGQSYIYCPKEDVQKCPVGGRQAAGKRVSAMVVQPPQ